ncbi:unnamed protein product, partial [Amoebophrya sp. A25]
CLQRIFVFFFGILRALLCCSAFLKAARLCALRSESRHEIRDIKQESAKLRKMRHSSGGLRLRK